MMNLLTSALIAVTLAAGTVNLPAPDKQGGKPLMQALTERHTTREFKQDALSEQDISNILYAAYGVNRANGKHTIPLALGIKNMTVYAAFPEGVYRYDDVNNQLVQVLKEDIRGKTFMRASMPLSAPVVLIYTGTKSEKVGKDILCAHAGSAYQNVYLYCASAGLNAVICGGFDHQALKEALNLTDPDVEVLFTQIIGKPVK